MSQVRALPWQPAGVAQLEERGSCKAQVVGSKPTAGPVSLAQPVERWTEDPEVRVQVPRDTLT